MVEGRSQTASGLAEPRFGRNDLLDGGFGRAWLALTVGFALHVLDEATTGFLNVYDPTVAAVRARWAWLPMPTFSFPEWLVGLIAGVVLCIALTPFAARGARWLPAASLVLYTDSSF